MMAVNTKAIVENFNDIGQSYLLLMSILTSLGIRNYMENIEFILEHNFNMNSDTIS